MYLKSYCTNVTSRGGLLVVSGGLLSGTLACKIYTTVNNNNNGRICNSNNFNDVQDGEAEIN